jgi:hypothetical protein
VERAVACVQPQLGLPADCVDGIAESGLALRFATARGPACRGGAGRKLSSGVAGDVPRRDNLARPIAGLFHAAPPKCLSPAVAHRHWSVRD